MSENLTVRRRQNVQLLFQAFAERALTAGTAPKGLEQAFAAAVQISPSMWSQIKAQRPIGDKMARQIERLCGKPANWLDQQQGDAGISDAERAFLDLALRLWRAENASGRRDLRRHLLQRIQQRNPGRE